MNEEYQIVYLDKPEWGSIGGGIHNYNTQQVGESNEQNLCFVLQGPDQEIACVSFFKGLTRKLLAV